MTAAMYVGGGRLAALATWASWALIGCIMASMFGACGCAPANQAAAKAVAETAVDLAITSGPMLVAAYEAQQEACLQLPIEQARACVKSVRAKWQPVKEAYGRSLTASCSVVPDEPACAKRAALPEGM